MTIPILSEDTQTGGGGGRRERKLVVWGSGCDGNFNAGPFYQQRYCFLEGEGGGGCCCRWQRINTFFIFLFCIGRKKKREDYQKGREKRWNKVMR